MSSYKSPLEGYEISPPLPVEFNADRSHKNLPSETKSSSYESFPPPFDAAKHGFDFHIYYMMHNKQEAQFARELHERIRRKFPELRIYQYWDKAIGPHSTSMFEVNTFTPHQTGAFFT